MFNIRMGDAIVGRAEIIRKGLYYHITCTCNPPSNEIHRVIMTDGSVKRDLGICVPINDGFSLFARVSVKSFSQEQFHFELVNGSKGEFVVSNDAPFAHLDKLETARLQQTDGQFVIIINSILSQQDNGQIQKYPNR